MGFGTNYDDIPQGGNELVPEGDYECIIVNAEIRKTQNGKYKVAFSLVIRNDVEQACKNRYLFVDVWRKREPSPSDEQVEGFNFAQLMAVSRAAQIPSGQSFESLEQFLKCMVNRLVIAHATHDDYNDKWFVRCDPLDLMPTQYPECRHVMKEKRQAAQNPAYSAPRQNQAYAQRPPQQYAQSKYSQTTDALGTPYRPPRKASASASAPVQPPAGPLWTPQQAPAANAPAPPSIGSLSEFEDILQDGELPF